MTLARLINVPLGPTAIPLGPDNVAALARPPLPVIFAGPRFVMNGAAPEIQPIDGVAFAEGKPHLVSSKSIARGPFSAAP